MQHRRLVEREARAEVQLPLDPLHHLHGAEEDPRPVVADHGLGDAVRGLRGRGRADLEPGDAHHVRVERLLFVGV